MKKLNFILLLFCTINLFSQKEVDLYNSGNQEFAKNNYLSADSFFTVSIKTMPSVDAIYNRALTRLVLGDTCFSCIDLYVASKVYADLDATKLFTKHCLFKADTIFYDNKYLIVNKDKKYKYYEVTSYPKCDKINNGEIHKINHKQSITISLGNFMIKECDIIATYDIVDTSKFYTFNFNSHFKDNNSEKLKKIQIMTGEFINRTTDIKILKKLNGFFYLKIFVDAEGKIIDLNFTDKYKNIFETETQNSLKDYLSKNLTNSIKFVPEKFMRKKVASIYILDVKL